MSQAGDLQGLARGIAFRLKENLGVLKRESVADEIKALDQAARADLRKYGCASAPSISTSRCLLKPAAAELAATLWLLKNGGTANGVDAATAAAPGSDVGCRRCRRCPKRSIAPTASTSAVRAPSVSICWSGSADLIRPLLAWRVRAGQARHAAQRCDR